MEGKKVCIVSAGNAAHVLAAMWPHMGFETYLWSGFRDEAERMNKGLEAGPITATFAEGNPFEGDIQGKPVKVAKDPAEVIPQCDVIFAPLPSFAYESVFTDLKPHLRKGHYVCVTPGAGGADWIAHKVLGDELFNDITLFTLSPMPFNCRIEEWSRSVKVQVLKQRYDICAQPVSRMQECIDIASALMPKSECAGLGPVLAATLLPLNPVIHPARVYTLLTEHNQWEPGKTLPENPFFYEAMTEADTANQIKINDDLDAIVAAANAQGVELRVPDCYNYIAKTYNGIKGDYPPVEKPTPADLVKLWHGPMYKTFRCPMKQEEGSEGWVPDFENRYFTEDIPCGLCTFKGVAQLFATETPTIDKIILWAQGYMGKEYVKDGNLNEALIGEMYVPQRYGITTVDDLKKVMGIDKAKADAELMKQWETVA